MLETHYRSFFRRKFDPSGLLVAHSFDTGTSSHQCQVLMFHSVKTRLQNPIIYSKYKSTLQGDAFGSIVREERFTGFYKPLFRPSYVDYVPSALLPSHLHPHRQATCAFMNGLVFSSYKFFMRAQLDDPSSVPSLTQVGLAGAGCGIVTS